MEVYQKAYAEVLHLLFLRQFHQSIDPKLYAIKGGCNLRFFFGSIRYSEDLDIDVQIVQKATLQQKVDKILSSVSFIKMLYPYGIRELQYSVPKQTETTQRWKIQLHTERFSMPISTKIEFSRRSEAFQSELMPVAIDVCRTYRLSPMRLSHYNLKNAIEQKVAALAYRTVTQARDVFDLYHLLHQGKVGELSIAAPTRSAAQEALANIRYQDFESQVVSFLIPNEMAHFSDPSYWNAMLAMVSQFLQEVTLS